MNKIFSNRIKQKGGLMIEALAMLGLIAVVTPTMYKKSAERALEVEDINTATTMRTFMGATNSLLGARYGEIIAQMRADDNRTDMTLDIDDLRPYLPYNFDTSKALYDFEPPRIGIHRDGNSLTAFLLFDAKAEEDSGLGQERTARIASMIGASGGYVSAPKHAKGIGGIWELDGQDFENVFGDDANIYSIVTASSDAINNINTEEDTDKFLYRTYTEGEEWRNTMRADLFMGRSDDNDNYNKDGIYSIRNVKRLIIGAQSFVDDANTMTAEEMNTAEGDNSYGLYMTGDNSSAFITGTLEAAKNDSTLPNFRVDGDALITGVTPEGYYSLKVDKDNLYYGYEVEPDAYNFSVNQRGDVSASGNVDLASGATTAWSDVNIGSLSSGHLIDGEYDEGKGKLSLINEDTVLLQGRRNDGGNAVDFDDRIVINNHGDTKDENGDAVTAISYHHSPTFPVRIGSNVKVDGILSTAQLDTQKIRTAELEVGSVNVDDEYKWLTVDADGVRISDPQQAENNKLGTSVHIDENQIMMGVGLNEDETGTSNTNKLPTYVSMDETDGIKAQSDKNIDVAALGDDSEIAIRNKVIGARMNADELKIAPEPLANGNAPAGAEIFSNLTVENTNVVVNDENGTVFAIRGNQNIDQNSVLKDRDTATDTYNVAVHGNAVFTPAGITDDNARYMSVGRHDEQSAVNVGSGTDEPQYTQVLTVDAYTSAASAIPSEKIETDANDNGELGGGTVYIRKGLVAVHPQNIPNGSDAIVSSAEQGYGVVQASRFVANNANPRDNALEGKVKVPDIIKDTEFAEYNGTQKINRYDTYMVNPAYTSVMHDIKLTTRGGARLSDVLPDFITKGVYIVNNTYKDDLKELKFKYDDGEIKVGNSTPHTFGDTSFYYNSESSWASPYMGVIPAPQCPPGYVRLVTMSPQSFMMGQAGQLKKGVYSGSYSAEVGDFYYVNENTPDPSAFNDNSLNADVKTQEYMKLEALPQPEDVHLSGYSGDLHIDGTFHATSETGRIVAGYRDEDSNGTPQPVASANPAYVLVASSGDKTPPLTIQQSTWLKTNVVPVMFDGSTSTTATYTHAGVTATAYPVGWAALMGFVYPADIYATFVNKTSNLKQFNTGGDTQVYWNIFPVRRNTLEAYASTYCYFDRRNMYGGFKENNDDVKKHVDQYDYLHQLKNPDVYNGHPYQKVHYDTDYIERLNDPTLKYDEVW